MKLLARDQLTKDVSTISISFRRNRGNVALLELPGEAICLINHLT